MSYSTGTGAVGYGARVQVAFGGLGLGYRLGLGYKAKQSLVTQDQRLETIAISIGYANYANYANCANYANTILYTIHQTMRHCDV